MTPGYVGLAVNHALALGLPVVTCRTGPEGTFHSPEVEFVVPGRTGMFAEPFDAESLANCALEVYRNRVHCRKAAAEYAEQKLTLDKMVQGFVDAIEYARRKRK